MKTVQEQFPLMFAIANAFGADGEYFFCLMTNGHLKTENIKGTNLTLENHHDGHLLRVNGKDLSLRQASSGAIFLHCHTITLAAMPGADLPEEICNLLKQLIALTGDHATVNFLTPVICGFPWANTPAYRCLKNAITSAPTRRAA